MVGPQVPDAADPDVSPHAPGDDHVHQQAVAEALLAAPLPELAQAPELGEREGEGDVVADGADVPEVVRDALALGEDRAQVQRPGRDHAAHRPLEGLAGRPGVGDGGVPGDPAGEPGESLGIAADRRLLDALVDVAEALLEPQDLFAHRVEAEVPGLDDAGVHRPHGDLEDPAAVHPREGVVGVGGRGARGLLARREVVGAQGIAGLGPGLVARPAVGLGVVHELETEQVVGVALGAVRGRELRGEGGQARAGEGHPGLEHQVAAALLEGAAHEQRVPLEVGPEGGPPAAEGRGDGPRPRPVLRVDREHLGGGEHARRAPPDPHQLLA